MKLGLATEMRAIDDRLATEFSLPAVALMENAGQRTALVLEELLGDIDGKNIVVVAGSGNNGGDAFAAARHLHNKMAKVKVFALKPLNSMAELPKNMFNCLLNMGVPSRSLTEERDWNRLRVALRFADGVVDGILGTGTKGELREEIRSLIEEINKVSVPVLAIDVPSGVSADTGRLSAAVRATATLAVGLPKLAHFLSPASEYAGRLFVDDIGIPRELLVGESFKHSLIDDELARELLPQRASSVHKGDCGRILVVAGSRGMTGAALLAAKAALRAGAGLVTLAVPQTLYGVAAGTVPEVITVPIPDEGMGCFSGTEALNAVLALVEQSDSVLIGPGLGRAAETLEFVRLFAGNIKKPLIMDADALFAYRITPEVLKELPQMPILTPHLGEFAGLVGKTVEELKEDLVAEARRISAEYQCVLVLKSENTLITYPDGDVFFATTGNAGMATAGSGDVLAGTIAGLVPQMDSGLAPIVGVHLHGLAGNLAYENLGNGLIASDIIAQLPQALQNLANSRQPA